MTIRVAVFGAGGRMGQTVCGAVVGDPELELVGAVDPARAGDEVQGVAIDPEPAALADRGVDVVIDFTVLAAARENLAWTAGAGVHAVVGTTGFGDDDLSRLREAFTRS